MFPSINFDIEILKILPLVKNKQELAVILNAVMTGKQLYHGINMLNTATGLITKAIITLAKMKSRSYPYELPLCVVFAESIVHATDGVKRFQRNIIQILQTVSNQRNALQQYAEQNTSIAKEIIESSRQLAYDKLKISKFEKAVESFLGSVYSCSISLLPNDSILGDATIPFAMNFSVSTQMQLLKNQEVSNAMISTIANEDQIMTSKTIAYLESNQNCKTLDSFRQCNEIGIKRNYIDTNSKEESDTKKARFDEDNYQQLPTHMNDTINHGLICEEAIGSSPTLQVNIKSAESESIILHENIQNQQQPPTHDSYSSQNKTTSSKTPPSTQTVAPSQSVSSDQKVIDCVDTKDNVQASQGNNDVEEREESIEAVNQESLQMHNGDDVLKGEGSSSLNDDSSNTMSRRNSETDTDGRVEVRKEVNNQIVNDENFPMNPNSQEVKNEENISNVEQKTKESQSEESQSSTSTTGAMEGCGAMKRALTVDRLSANQRKFLEEQSLLVQEEIIKPYTQQQRAGFEKHKKESNENTSEILKKMQLLEQQLSEQQQLLDNLRQQLNIPS